MQRLFEGETRADSITFSAPLPRGRTQASNFSLCRRSAAFEVTTTVSMPNWRKHSASSARDESGRLTKAVRAAVFRKGAPKFVSGARTEAAKDFSIGSGERLDAGTILRVNRVAGKTPKGQRAGSKSSIDRAAREATCVTKLSGCCQLSATQHSAPRAPDIYPKGGVYQNGIKYLESATYKIEIRLKYLF